MRGQLSLDNGFAPILASSEKTSRDILDCLENIYRFARKGLKEEAVYKKLGQASSFSPKLFAETAKKAKHFAYLNGRLTPKEVLCSEVEDDNSTYENRFAKMILVRLIDELGAAYSNFRYQSSLLPIINNGLSYSKYGNALPLLDYIEGANGGEQEKKLHLLDELLYMKQEAETLGRTYFFQTLIPLKEENVHQTNALAYDPLYGALYRSYMLSNASFDSEKSIQKIVNDFSDGRDIVKGNEGKLPLSFRFADCLVSLRRLGDSLIMKASNIYDGFALSYEVKPRPSFFYPSYELYGEGKKALISLFGSIDTALPLKTLLLSVPDQGDYCPICGNKRTGDVCHYCDSTFHCYTRGEKKAIQLLDLPFMGKEEERHEQA